MGSSGSSNFSPSATPSPPGNLISPPGQTAGGNIPSYPSFLPSAPGQMATGLTPQMIAQIEGAQQARPQAPQQGGGGGGFGYAQLLDFARQLGGGGFPAPSPGSILSQARRGGNVSRDQVRQAAQSMMFGLPMMPNIPRPVAGPNGQVNPADVAAYNAAQAQAKEAQRDAIARMLSSRKLGGKGWSPHRR